MSRKMRRIAAVAAMLCLAAAGAWAAGEPIKIGAVFSVTGPASFLGEPERNTAKMLEAQINKAGGVLGRPVEVIVYDDETDATKAVTAFDRLVKKDQVVAVIGPSTTGNTLAIVPKAEEYGIPLVSCASAKKIVDPLKKWVFKTAQSDDLAVKQIYKHMKATGISKVAILTASDGYGSAGREELKRLAPEYSIALIADEVFGPKDTDMTSQLTKIKGTEAQAIICWGTNPGPAVIARNRVQLGITLPLYNSSGVASKKYIELAGKENAEGVMLPAGRLIVEAQVPADDPRKKALNLYRTSYESQFKQDVSTFGGHSWDALYLVAEAVKLMNSAEPAAIRDGLEKVTKFYGAAGEFNFSPTNHEGLTEDAFAMIRIVNGDWVMIK
ncbi:MAG TPA: ABC transporter substrate-binding protein [Geobacteraceae bacterium]